MDSKITKVDFPTGNMLNVKMVDNGDDTYSPSVSMNGATTDEGALNVTVKHTHTNMINQQFHQETTTITNFASSVTTQDRSFTVDSVAGFSVGDKIKVMDGVVEYNYPEIIDITGTTITIDRPLDRSYTTDDGIMLIYTNMAVDGSVTPQSFKIKAEMAEAVTHITRLLFSLTHNSSGDMGKFGGIDGLDNGVIMRAYYDRTGEYKTVTNWKTNGDMGKDLYDIRFDTRSGGQGDYGTTGRWTLTEAGIVAELYPNDIDFIEVLVQDDLTGLDSFIINAQGHTVD